MNRFVIVLACTFGWAALAAAQIAVYGEVIHTMAGPPIENGVVVIRDGKISAVGKPEGISVPRDFTVLRAKVVTPGLVDAHSVVGLAGYLNQEQDQDQIDRSAPIQPELRALDAYNAKEPLVEYLRGFGVTTLHTGHAPGPLVAGQTLIAKTRSTTAADAVIVPEAMIACTLGAHDEPFGSDEDQETKGPGTRAKAAAMLRQELIAAQDWLAKRDAPAEPGDEGEDEKPGRDLRKEAFARVLKREIPLLVTAHRHQDIATALRIADEFDIRVVLDGASESYTLIEEIKAAGVPVIVHPTMYRASGDRENLAMTTAAALVHAGIPVALQSGYESYVPKTRVVLFEAGVACAHGLTFDEALATITIGAARILGIDARVGSIQPGKDGDLALFDGDPFEYTSHCTGVVLDGDSYVTVR